MLFTIILGDLTLLSFALLLWQFIAAWCFPMHRRIAEATFNPAVTILKPLRGATEHTKECLRSWMTQQYGGCTQFLFGVADENDPACEVVRELLREYPNADAALLIAPDRLGPNGKVSTLVQITPHTKHDLICISDADVRVPEDFLANAMAPLRDASVGLVNCFYQLANPSTLAMKWEAIAVNADFWSQVLQSNTIKPQDFALGAVMATRREALAQIGGIESLIEYLADDYQLGRRIAATGARIELSPVVVECWDKSMTFREVWNHQVRWARTIRACQPVPYFFSVLSNVTLWAVLLALGSALRPGPGRNIRLLTAIAAVVLRMITGSAMAAQLTQRKSYFTLCWLLPFKDLFQFGIWAAAFSGNTVVWRENRFCIGRGGRLIPL